MSVINTIDLSYGIVGVTDEVTQCGCCGKQNLKRTVVFKVDEEKVGEGSFEPYVFLGTTCAQRAFGKRGKASKSTRKVSRSQIYRIELTAKVGNHVAKLVAEPDENTCPQLPKFSFSANGHTRDRLPLAWVKEYLTDLSWYGEVSEFLEKVIELHNAYN